MDRPLTLTTANFLRRSRIQLTVGCVTLAVVAVFVWLTSARSVAVIVGALAGAVAVVAILAPLNLRRLIPAGVSFSESGIRLWYLNGDTREVSWVEIDSVRRVSSGPRLVTLRNGRKITIRTSREDAPVLDSRFIEHQVRVI